MDTFDEWFEEDHNSQPPSFDKESIKEPPSSDNTMGGFIVVDVIS